MRRLLALLLVAFAGAGGGVGTVRAQAWPEGLGTRDGFGARDGPNRLPSRPLRWQTLATPDLDVFFPEEAAALAADAAAVAAEVLPGLEALVGVALPSRIPLLVYPAPRTFSASVPVRLGRDAGAVEGLSDPARGRIVLTYTGDRRAFRQTLVHELVHALLRARYGDAGLRALLPLRRRAVLPVWMEEGLAEYAATGYGPSSDHLVRAAVAQGTLPDPPALRGALVYAGGASFFHFLALEYGPQTLAAVLDAAARTGDGTAALALATGVDAQGLYGRWHDALEDAVLPELAARERLDERARATPIAGRGAFLSGPAFSPSGDRLALVVEDEGGTRLVVLDLAAPGPARTLLAAGPGLPLDALHPGRTVAWSPDGRRVAVAAAEPTREVVVLVDVASERTTLLPATGFVRLTGLAYKPDGSALALAGVRGAHSDLALMSLADGRVQALTNDPPSDDDPVWTSDTALVFASDRGDALARDGGTVPAPDAARSPNLYRLALFDPRVERLTRADADERPLASLPGEGGVVFLSDASGLANLYVRRPDGAVEALSNLFVGLDDAALSSDGLRVAYLSPGPDGAPRLWLGRQPLDRMEEALPVPTAFARAPSALSLASRLASPVRRAASAFLRATEPSPDSLGVSFVIDERRMDSLAAVFARPDDEPAGEPAAQPYRLRFGLDALGAAARVDPLYGVQGRVEARASDVLGRHRVRVASNLLLDLRASDYEAVYAYQPYRTTYTARLFHQARFAPQTAGAAPATGALARLRYRHLGGSMGVAWRLTPYDRVEADVALSVVTRRDVLAPALPSEKRSAVVGSLVYLRDVALPEDVPVPRRGSRLRVSISGTPAALSGTPTAFVAARLDARVYRPLFSNVGGALRLLGGTSFGPTPARWFAAGTDGWLAPRLDSAAAYPIRTLNDFALATPLTPLRGYAVAQRTGPHALAASAEVRLPLGLLLVPYPGAAPGLVRLDGVLFADAGWVWGDVAGDFGPLLASGGGGVRTALLGVPLRLDLGWPFDGERFGTPLLHVSLGVDF